MLIDDIRLICDNEKMKKDLNIVKHFINGKPQSSFPKNFPGVLYEEDTAKHTISTRNIEMMRKLYEKIDDSEKELLVSELSKSFDHQETYYHDINYFAFAVLLLLDKKIALSRLEFNFVVDSDYAATLVVLNLILVYKHDYFAVHEINGLKLFLGKTQELIDSFKPPKSPIPHGRILKEENERSIFIRDSHTLLGLFGKTIIPRLRATIHEIEYHRLGKYLEDINPEINTDKLTLINKMDELGFPEDAKKCLEEIDKIYFGTPDKFECKSCMGFIRSFIEEMFGELVLGMVKVTGTPYESESDRKLPQRVDCFEIEFFGILEPGGLYETVTI